MYVKHSMVLHRPDAKIMHKVWFYTSIDSTYMRGQYEPDMSRVNVFVVVSVSVACVQIAYGHTHQEHITFIRNIDIPICT
jgi:hypothetical protein